MTLLDQSSYDAKVVEWTWTRTWRWPSCRASQRCAALRRVFSVVDAWDPHPTTLGKDWPRFACVWTFGCLLWCTARGAALRRFASQGSLLSVVRARAWCTRGKYCDLRHWCCSVLRLHSQAELKMLRPVSVGSSDRAAGGAAGVCHWQPLWAGPHTDAGQEGALGLCLLSWLHATWSAYSLNSFFTRTVWLHIWTQTADGCTAAWD